MSEAPLTSIRVLDLTRLLPGPYCSRIFADFGAEVIRIEPPSGGDWLRSAAQFEKSAGALFNALNRGKKSMTLDLKADEGKNVLIQLAGTADVFFESFRPGVMDRLGLGHKELKEENPRLITCSLTGYGDEGSYRGRAGHDLNYIGLTGLLDLTGSSDSPPVIPATQVADIMGALWSTIGILVSLLCRERIGEARQVSSSLLGAAIASLPVSWSRVMAGEPEARGQGDLIGGMVCYNVYETRDGRYITLAALEPNFWNDFCMAAGVEDLLGDQLARAVPDEPVYERLKALFRSRTADEWQELLAGVDACCEPVLSIKESTHADPVMALGLITEAGILPPVQLSSTRGEEAAPAPDLGEHTIEVLIELGFSNEMIEGMRERGVI
ncbi:MAG: CoA transferase [Anaerolineales bacterium]|nr:CoA transferase [Anaerolineales bacterium]